MSTKEKAELLSSNAAAEMPGYLVTGGPIDIFHSVEAAEAISKLCCLIELLDVVEAAEDYLVSGDCPNPIEYHDCNKEECDHCNLKLKLRALHAKLPKEML